MGTKRRPLDPGLELDVGRLCEAIEAERISRELTHQRVADELRVTYNTMCYWRRGCGGMSGDVALRIAVWLRADLRRFARHPADPLPAAKGEAALTKS